MWGSLTLDPISFDSRFVDLENTGESATLKQKLYNFATYMLKAYLSTQPSSLSAFIVSKTHTVAQKPREKQLNAKVYDSEQWRIYNFVKGGSNKQ